MNRNEVRKALVELDALYDWAPQISTSPDMYREDLDRLAKKLEALAALDDDGWHFTDEGLEKGTEYNVLAEAPQEKRRVTSATYYSAAPFWRMNDEWIPSFRKILAWRELPPPPEAQTMNKDILFEAQEMQRELGKLKTDNERLRADLETREEEARYYAEELGGANREIERLRAALKNIGAADKEKSND